MKAISARLRTEFSERLQGEFEQLGLPVSSPTRLARLFNQKFPDHPVTPQTVRKWLLAEAMPTQGKLLALAQWFEVSAQWLRFGTGCRKEIRPAGDAPAAGVLVLGAECAPLIPLVEMLAKLPPRELQLVKGIVGLILADGG